MDSLTIRQSVKTLIQSLCTQGRLNTTLEGEGSFACVLADSVPPVWIGAGPADMNPTTASSSRPELIG